MATEIVYVVSVLMVWMTGESIPVDDDNNGIDKCDCNNDNDDDNTGTIILAMAVNGTIALQQSCLL